MDNTQTVIQILEKALDELKKQQRKNSEQIEFEQYIKDKIIKIEEELAAIKRAIA